ncbi:CHAT domain-containing protein [Scytonema hofmannii]|uniref:CHAT domain-containing protein n=1 Tax=Scytonema hofmannii TaxID=34078 RepID=UPI00034DEE3F|nr:CHAT domain-containing protein [Scytonema hofmannii]
MAARISNFYQVGASLPVDAPSYVKRLADEEFYQKLKAGKFCYVLNSRQMGKSSLRVQTMQRLQASGTVCAAIDLTGIGKHKVTLAQWYGGIVYALVESCQLEDKFDFDWQTWWQKHQEVFDPVMCLRLFIEKVLLVKIEQQIVIFVDEIDRVLSQDFSLDDFFALIRFFQNQRVDNPAFERLTFALLGVATPSDLITDKTQTPFNIGEAIELHGFQIDEVEPLIKGLRLRFRDPQAVMKEILDWTGGQPFLTQKLCQFMVEESEKENPRTVEEVVRSRIIENWESQDEPEHLRTIRDRILRNEQRAPYLLELYQQIQQYGEIATNNNVEISELQLSGLVVKQQGKLRVYNCVYQEVFDQNWIETQLKNLRPYSENFKFWIASGGVDRSRLLRGKALQDALEWARDKNLNYQDKEFLAASQAKETEEEIAALEKEAELERERKDREAVEKRNQVLTEANKKAQRRISIGTIVLILTLVITAILGILAGREVVKARSAAEEAKQAQQAQREAEKRAIAAAKKVQQAQAKATVAEDRATKATQTVQQIQQEVALATAKLKKAQQDAQIANQNEKVAKQRVQQAQQEVALATAKLKKAQQDAQAANQNEKVAKQRVQQAQQEVASTKIWIKQTKQEIQNVSQLSALGGELYKAQKQSEAEQAWKQASLSFEIRDLRLKQAMLLNNISIAYQQLGKLTEANKAVSDSLKLLQTDVDQKNSTDRLVILAQALNAKGRLLESQKNIKAALSAYTEAFNSLQSLGSDLTSINPAIQVSFEDTVEHVYRSLIGALLQTSKETGFNQQNLKKTRQLIESLFLTELNNFRKLAPLNAHLKEIDEINPQATAIYPILLDDRLDIIIHSPQQPLRYHSTNISQKEMKTLISNMQKYVQKFRVETKDNVEMMLYSKKLYSLLIKPIEADLIRSRSTNLVFILDGSLQDIPIAALYNDDGKQYLVEKYAITLTPALQILDPQPSRKKPLIGLIAGISESQNNFAAMPAVKEEVATIRQIIVDSHVLLNSAVTSTALKKAINSSASIIHLAVNGQYSSNPEETFILVWDKRIKERDFEQLLLSREKDKFNPIELLVLSSCQSAEGSDRVLFGLGGVALRSGVRSTVATLWEVNDKSTAEFMGEFYKQLIKPSVTKAEALRNAQLILLKSEFFKEPFYWAPFVLIGNG